jgi:hypothetical protein
MVKSNKLKTETGGSGKYSEYKIKKERPGAAPVTRTKVTHTHVRNSKLSQSNIIAQPTSLATSPLAQ